MSAMTLTLTLCLLGALLLAVTVWALKPQPPKVTQPDFEHLVAWHTGRRPVHTSPDPRDALVAGFARLQKR